MVHILWMQMCSIDVNTNYFGIIKEVFTALKVQIVVETMPMGESVALKRGRSAFIPDIQRKQDRVKFSKQNCLKKSNSIWK